MLLLVHEVHVSYLGSSFCGWTIQPDKRSVQGTLIAAIASAGLNPPPPLSGQKLKRTAAKAARRAAQKQAAAAATADAPGAAAMSADSTDPSSSRRDQLAIIQHGLAAGRADSLSVVDEGIAANSHKKPIVHCAGRTDAGVTAVGQVVSWYTWGDHLKPDALVALLNKHIAQALQGPEWEQVDHTTASCSQHLQAMNASGNDRQELKIPSEQQQQLPQQPPVACQIRVWQAEAVPRQFHATYGATWRRYVYLLPLRRSTQPGTSDLLLQPCYTGELYHAAQTTSMSEQERLRVQQAVDLQPAAVNAVLQQLQGRRLDYYAYARDTPKDKNCECLLHMARASCVRLPPTHAANNTATHKQQPEECLCIELVGNRFLRKMVRVLVATAVRAAVAHEAVAHCQSQGQLLQLTESLDRTKTAQPAPGLGLCFVAAAY
eukprot:GHRR01016251.1.p1 GENE.GHRR01016251.1~~GHRR01016251.1.p1  ORF type:complete len:433 (+),score=157.16 GHRR01016251.1:991-2289(+)